MDTEYSTPGEVLKRTVLRIRELQEDISQHVDIYHQSKLVMLRKTLDMNVILYKALKEGV